jgi:hypothetical protein
MFFVVGIEHRLIGQQSRRKRHHGIQQCQRCDEQRPSLILRHVLGWAMVNTNPYPCPTWIVASP